MNRFYPGVRVRAEKEIVSSQGEFVAATPAVIREGSIGVVITRRECKKQPDNARVVVQFPQHNSASGVLVACTIDMISLAE